MSSEFLVGRPSAFYREQREIQVNAEKKVPRVKIYNPNNPKDRRNLFLSLVTLPLRNQLEPWVSDDPDNILAEAKARGYIHDGFPDYLEDHAKIATYLGDDPENPKPRGYYDTRPDELEEYKETRDLWENSRIVEFEWESGVGRYGRIPPEEGFFPVVHSRDGKHISPHLRKKRVAYGGAGVGGSLLEGAVRAGVQKIKVADGGLISYHDMNRVQDPDVTTVGENHAADVTKRIYKANPYIDAECIMQNLSIDGKPNTYEIRKFLEGSDIVFEEVDNLAIKIAIREIARDMGIPVIMATDVKMGTIIDYQHLKPGDSNDLIFPGVPRDIYNRVKAGEKFSWEEVTEIAIQIVGKEASYWRDEVAEGTPFWSQTGAAADASKAKSAEVLSMWADGKEIPPRQTYLDMAA